MNIEEAREFCLALKGSNEGMPFGDGVLIFKVLTKMYASLALDGSNNMNLKCDPERAIELRASFPYVLPGYHMNKKHWNTLENIEEIPNKQLIELIEHSYELVRKGLTKSQQKELDERWT